MRQLIKLFSLSILVSTNALADTCANTYHGLPFKQAMIQQFTGVYCEYGTSKSNENYLLEGNFTPATGPWVTISSPWIESQIVCPSSDSSNCVFATKN